jgi:hypothetical protein
MLFSLPKLKEYFTGMFLLHGLHSLPSQYYSLALHYGFSSEAR